jgi:hypothetical protein
MAPSILGSVVPAKEEEVVIIPRGHDFNFHIGVSSTAGGRKDIWNAILYHNNTGVAILRYEVGLSIIIPQQEPQ